MSSIPGFQFNVTGASGTLAALTPKNGWRAYVLPRGGYASQDSTGTLITFDSASVAARFSVGNWIQAGLAVANIRQVGAVGGNSLSVSGSALTISENARIYLIGNTEPTVTGGSATYTTPNTLIRQRDDDGADLYTNSMITTNADGLIQGFGAAGIYDIIIQDGNRTNQGSVVELEIASDNWPVRRAEYYSGANAGAKIAAAIADLPSTGGTVDARALNSAQTVTADFFSGVTKSTHVILGHGTYTTDAQIIVPSVCQLTGQGRGISGSTATIIRASATFPTSTAVVRLGAGASLAFGCRVEDLQINCATISGSKGIYSTDINEQSGVKRVLVINYMNRGIDIEDDGSQIPDNFLVEDVELACDVTATGTVGLRYSGSRRGGTVDRITVNPNGAAADQADGVLIVGTVAGGARLTVRNINVERHTDGIEIGTSAGGHVENATLLTSGTNLVNVVGTQEVTLLNLYRGVGTNTVNNTTTGAITASRVPFYFSCDTTDGYQVFTSAGRDATTGNVVSAVQPMWMVKSTATSGANSRANMELRDGNNDGWRVRFGADGTNDPLQLLPITGGTLGSAVWALQDTGTMTVGGGVVFEGTSNANLTQAATLTLPDGFFFGISGTLGAGTSISNMTQTTGRNIVLWSAIGTMGFSSSNTLRIVGNSINVPVNGAVQAFCTGTTWFVFSPSS